MEREVAGSPVPRRSVLLGAGAATGALLMGGHEVTPSVAAAVSGQSTAGVTRTGYPSGPDESAPLIDAREVLAATSFGFQLVAGEHSGPGTWLYRDFLSRNADRGLTGLYIVE